MDLVLTSPPYCMGKDYETYTDTADFVSSHEKIMAEIVRVTKDGGHICWQVGSHVKDNVVTPLDFLVYEILRPHQQIKLRNRIVWTFGHGLHSNRRFSGRHETLLWYTKGDDYKFNIDCVRVPQKYPGKRHYKGEKVGEFSGNPLGKNPGDVWDIPNVKANHIEKTDHPCQFPMALALRAIRALTDEGDTVLDPYFGTGSSAAAAIKEGRRFVGAEMDPDYWKIAVKRLEEAAEGTLKYREDGIPVYTPVPGSKLTITPEQWQKKQPSKQPSK